MKKLTLKKTFTLALFSTILTFISVNTAFASTELQISNDLFNQTSPSIYANKVVYTDDRNGYRDVFMLDLLTMNETQITNDEVTEWQPIINGNRIVWAAEGVDGYSDVYVYDLVTKTKTNITNDPAHQIRPVIDGDIIVWQDLNEQNYDGNSDIYMYNLATQQKTQITFDPSDQMRPAISGNKVVWQDYRNNNYDIFLYDIITKKETQLTTDPANQTFSSIDGNLVAWHDFRNETWNEETGGGHVQIGTYNLLTGEEKLITNDAGYNDFPFVNNNKVYWDRNLNDLSEIFVYDSLTGTTEQITNSTTAFHPVAYGENIVWQDSRSGNYHIYLLQTKRLATVTASLNSGNYPKKIDVNLTSSNPDTKIYYTLDGSEPTAASQLYTEAIGIHKSAILKAVAIDTTGAIGPVFSAEYIIKNKPIK